MNFQRLEMLTDERRLIMQALTFLAPAAGRVVVWSTANQQVQVPHRIHDRFIDLLRAARADVEREIAALAKET